MNKRFYVFIFLIMFTSALLLGFSYASESGRTDVSFLAQVKNDDYRVVFSNNRRLDTRDNSKVEIGIVNKDSENSNFVLKLSEMDQKNYDNVYYSLDGNDFVELNNGIIDLGEVNKKGSKGDFIYHIVELKSDEDYEFSLNVDVIELNLLSNYIKNSSETFVDENSNVRYYGTEVNNYINYNNHLYRIVGIIDGNIKLVDSSNSGLGIFSSNEEYLSLDDYLYSFIKEKIDVSETLNSYSWLTTQQDFWLSDSLNNQAYLASDTDGVILVSKYVSYYRRHIVYITGDCYVDSGDGTLNSPFEVSYGSK